MGRRVDSQTRGGQLRRTSRAERSPSALAVKSLDVKHVWSPADRDSYCVSVRPDRDRAARGPTPTKRHELLSEFPRAESRHVL